MSVKSIGTSKYLLVHVVLVHGTATPPAPAPLCHSAGVVASGGARIGACVGVGVGAGASLHA